MALTARAIPGWLHELTQYRQLLISLTWRDIRVRYKQSMLGILWAILLPLSLMLVFTFVFTRAVDVRSVLQIDTPYALYAFAGLVPWTFFATSLSGCVSSLVANRNLVTKVYFPREVFPLSCIASCFVDFCIAMAVLAGLMAYFHVTTDWAFAPRLTWLALPGIVALQILFTVGLGLLLAMANLFYRDVRQVFGVVIQLWMFVSAVVVPVPTDGTLLARLIALNPMVAIISAYRDCLLYGRWPAGGSMLYALFVTIALLVVGARLFRRSSYRFAECI